MSETICRKCDTPIYGQHKGFDTKPPSFEHLKCPTCPDCGHGFTYHANGKCITALSSIGQGCPCTRTYESLVGEKGSKTAKELGIECECVNWSVREYKEWEAARYGQHHPNCDGKGGHKELSEAEYKAIRDAKPEPSLSLLIIDLGDNVIIKTERGEIDIKLGGVTYQCRTTGLQDTSLYSFADVRNAIEGEDRKPVPRIEWCEERLQVVYGHPENVDYRLFDYDAYDALSTLAGKPLPIYEGGVWEELTVALHKKEGVGWVWIDERDLTVWRYRR